MYASPYLLFPELPESARVWVFTSSREVSDDRRQSLIDQVRAFLEEWRSHGRPIRAEATFLNESSLVVAGYINEEENAGVSGCGIDALSHHLAQAARDHGLEWTGPLQILFRSEDDRLRVTSRAQFRALIQQGEIEPDTPVVDTTITTLSELRLHGLERPAEETWLRRMFRKTTSGA